MMLSKFLSIYGYFWMLCLPKETFTPAFPPSFNNSMSVIVPSGHLLPPAAVGLPLPYIVDCNLSQIGKYLFLESVLQIAPDVSEQTNTRLWEGGLLPQEPETRAPYWGHRLLSSRPAMSGKEMKEGHGNTSFPAMFMLLLFWLCFCLVGINLF